MNYNKTIKRQTIIIALSVIVMSIILISSTFALFNNKAKSTNAQVVTSGTLVIDYSESTGVTNEGDENGEVLPSNQSDTTAFDIKVKNTGNLGMDYKLLVHTGENNTLDPSLIMVQVNSEEAVVLSSLTKTSDTQSATGSDIRYILKSDTIAAAENNNQPVNTYNVKVWVDEDAEEEVIDDIIQVFVSVEGAVDESGE